MSLQDWLEYNSVYYNEYLQDERYMHVHIQILKLFYCWAYSTDHDDIVEIMLMELDDDLDSEFGINLFELLIDIFAIFEEWHQQSQAF